MLFRRALIFLPDFRVNDDDLLDALGSHARFRAGGLNQRFLIGFTRATRNSRDNLRDARAFLQLAIDLHLPERLSAQLIDERLLLCDLVLEGAQELARHATSANADLGSLTLGHFIRAKALRVQRSQRREVGPVANARRKHSDLDRIVERRH